MDREDRLPTRVSKACDRCKRQKQRCDYDRPCRHCLRAKTECTTTEIPGGISKKSRLRRQSAANAQNAHISKNGSSLPSGVVIQPAASPSEAHDRESTSSQYQSAFTPEDSERVSQVGLMWNTPATMNASDAQRSPSSARQLSRSDTNLPNFDSDSALAITRKIFRFQKSPAFISRATSAIPGGGGRHQASGTNSSNKAPAPLLPIVDIIGIELPNVDLCNKILHVYFSQVHWFSLVVYEPKFRERYNAIILSGLASRSDHGFLLLLLIVLIMGCWYTPKQKSRDIGISDSEMDVLRSKLLKVVQRDFMDLMDEDCLEFVQLCALLGSFYLYHGKPRSSFSILGAATKTAQAMELHRDSENKWSFEDKEERIRVWWTIYTWDRPLGINEKDCNVPMPSDVFESIQFDATTVAPICLSSYQFRLNQVYKIASPLLEDIYGLRTSQNAEFDLKLPEMVSTANSSLLRWHQDLPYNLAFDQITDLTANSSCAEKMHHLQALSLQLTYDNLMIVLHRPLLAAREYQSNSAGNTPSNLEVSDHIRETSFKRCLNSALRISNIQQKPNLFALARTTHLVSFLGMNLFTASVVLFICALSDTLSDTAQEAKRGLKRTLQMQKSLSHHASLSLQCSRILEDLVALILKKEMEEMLLDHSNNDENFPNGASTREAQDGNELEQEQVASNQTQPQMRNAATAQDLANLETPNAEGSHFMQSLETLQRVFYDTGLQRNQVGLEEDARNRRNYGEISGADDPWNQGGVVGAQQYNSNDGIFSSGVEDIGQFWLWDVDNFNF